MIRVIACTDSTVLYKLGAFGLREGRVPNGYDLNGGKGMREVEYGRWPFLGPFL